MCFTRISLSFDISGIPQIFNVNTLKVSAIVECTEDFLVHEFVLKKLDTDVYRSAL